MRDGGAALVLGVLLLLALTLLGYGALAVADAQGVMARAGAAQLRSRLVATAAARVEDSVAAPPRGAPIWTWWPVRRGRVEDVRYGTDVLPLGGEWWIVRGRAREGPGETWHSEARIGWRLDPVTRLSELSAVVTYGGRRTIGGGAGVSGDDIDATGEGGSARACAPHQRALDSLFPLDRLPATAPAQTVDSSSAGAPALGLLDRDRLEARLDPGPPGVLTPGPVVQWGRCRDALDNWGSPSDPTGPCGSRRVGLHVAGDLTLRGGEGQGVLAVDGQLRLESGVLFSGLVLVGDSLVLTGDARLLGAAVVGGDLVLSDGGRIVGRGCPVLLGLDASRPLKTPVHPSPGAWIRPF